MVHGDALYAFGGKSGRSPFNDLCAFHFERGEWEHVAVGAPQPARRCAHVCVVWAQSLFIIGGYDGRRYFDDCFEYCFQPPESQSVLSLAGDLESMVNSPQFSDIAFVVDGRTVHAHKFILFARCEHFRRMFTSGYKEAEAAQIGSRRLARRLPLRPLVSVHGKAGELSPEVALDVLGAANLYNIEPLKRLCADAIARGLCVENVAYVLQAADAYAALQLRSRCVDFMVDNFAAVVRSDAFADLVKTETRPLVLRFLEEASGRLTAAAPPALAQRSSGSAP